MANYADCPNYLSEFLFYMLTIKGRSQRTVDAYYIDLRTFLRYIKCVKLVNGNPDDPEFFDQLSIRDIPLETVASITLSDVYQFLNYAASDRDNNAKTRSRKVSSIRALFNYLTVKSGVLKTNPVENLEVPSVRKSMPRYLTLEESLELLTHVDPASPSYERDFCIVTLFLNCGMRLSELVGINLYDIRDDTIKLLGKGNKERVIYLNDACRKALDAYLVKRKPAQGVKDRDALFLSSRGTRISPRRVEQIIEECLRNAGLSGQGYSPHKLRHTAATLMYQHGGVDIRVLKEILGHVSLSTTEIYTHVSDRQMEKAAKQSPLSGVAPKKKSKVPKIPDSEDE
ncbi:tyrosine recombinase XerC [Anaerotruncus massiliensis (ex Liu et al. 2021)]|uniref:tyrosine recombinase XerC n=1 Tax=Anaerotruncus massiliensis (ex Liu et al. 2021) TaxID=2321404 RepID=UPI003AB8FEEE